MVTFKSSRPRFRFRTYRWTYRCTAKEEDRLIKSLIILVSSRSNFKLSTLAGTSNSSTKHLRKQWFNKGARFYFLEFAGRLPNELDSTTHASLQLPTKWSSSWAKEKDTSCGWAKKEEREKERGKQKREEGREKNGKERTVSWIVFCNAGFQVERRTGKAARSLRRKGGALTTDFPFNRFALRRSRDPENSRSAIAQMCGLGFRVAMKIDRFYSAREKATYPLSAFSLILILSLLLCFGGPLKRSPGK